LFYVFFQLGKDYFTATTNDVPYPTLQRKWRERVLESKKKQSAARISAIQTGAGESDAPLLGEEDARVLAIGQAEVVFDNQGQNSSNNFAC
jgi:hypothetical protein